MLHQTDIIIVGAGLAGLYTALNLPDHWHITILSSHDDNSSLAQGGVAACMDVNDSFKNHMDDTLKAGHYTNDPNAVIQLVASGPEEIQQLKTFGVSFDSDQGGREALTLEGGHSKHRVLHVNGDSTGDGIMSALRQRLAEKPNIKFVPRAKLLEITHRKNTATGVRYLHGTEIISLVASYTVLATGGIGDLFAQTTNVAGSMGIGIALAHQIGVRCRDLRYVQFHPTAFFDPSSDQRFLISEALRGEGALLIDEHHHRFMSEIDQRMELAPRDVIAKAIQEIIASQSKPYVYLDTRHLDSTFLATRFPGIHKHLSSHGIQMGKDLIPVTPVAHYTIGGIVVDGHGRTSMEQLYACGETTSSGVHGANRLASNSLLECLVYGRSISEDLKHRGLKALAPIPLKEPQWCRTFLSTTADPLLISTIQDQMTETAGIHRKRDQIASLYNHFRQELWHVEDQHLRDYGSFIIYNMLYVSTLLLKDAMAHPSKGCHHIENNADSKENHGYREVIYG